MQQELALRQPPPDPARWAAGALAVLVHALLASLLFFGVQWQTHPRESQEVAVELFRAAPPVEPAPLPRAAPEPTPPEPRPAPVPKVVPAPKPSPAKPDIALREKTRPKREPPPKTEAKPAPKMEPKPVPKADVKSPVTKTKPVDTSRPPAQDWSKELSSTEETLSHAREAQAAAQELQNLKLAQASSALKKAASNWGERIAAKVRGNIVLPPGITGNPQAEFDISLLPDGSVLAARLRKSSGNRALDAAIERAIYKSSPLPPPENPAVFQRELRSIFRPLENQ